MAWLPWQSTQTALPISPDFFDAIPWTLCSYAASTSWSGRCWYFSSRARSLWHRRQVADDVQPEGPRRGVLRFPDVVPAVAAVAPGTSVTPFARNFPWELPVYDFPASPWHLSQETFFSISCGAFASAWQVTQEFPVDRRTVRLQVDVERHRLPVGERLLDRLVPVAIHGIRRRRGWRRPRPAGNNAAAARAAASSGKNVSSSSLLLRCDPGGVGRQDLPAAPVRFDLLEAEGVLVLHVVPEKLSRRSR